MGSAEKGPAETGASSEPNMAVASEPTVEKTAAPEASDKMISEKAAADAPAGEKPISDPDDSIAASSASDAAVEAARESAKPRPGSSLILIPPVTRLNEGAQASPPPRSETAAGFSAARAAKKPPISKGAMLRYGVPAALGFCLFGAGIATGGQFFGTGTPNAASPAATAAALAPAAAGTSGKVVHVATADQTEMRHLTKKLTDEVHALQARVEAMRTAPQTTGTTSEDVRSLKKSVDALRASFESSKAETGATIAVLTAKIDRLQHDEARLQTPAERVVHGEKPITAAPITTASVTHPATPHVTGPAAPIETAVATPSAAKPVTQAATPSPSVEPKKKPQQMLVNWVVRDVYRGVALVEGPEGQFEVGRGDPIPGAGTVESIEKRNGGWVLVTSRGIVGSVRE